MGHELFVGCGVAGCAFVCKVGGGHGGKYAIDDVIGRGVGVVEGSELRFYFGGNAFDESFEVGCRW